MWTDRHVEANSYNLEKQLKQTLQILSTTATTTTTTTTTATAAAAIHVTKYETVTKKTTFKNPH